MSPAPHDPRPATSPRELRRFALTVGGAFLLLGALLLWRGRAAGWVVAAAGAALVVAGLAIPACLGPLQRGWMRLALAISRVTTPLFMGIVYFLVLTPIGIILRLLGRRLLGHPRGAATFWADRPPGERRSDLERQF